MICDDFEKKVLFWKLRGMYTQVETDDGPSAFFLVHDNITLKIVYTKWHNKYHFIMCAKTTFNKVTIDYKILELSELAEELEKL